MVVATPPTMTPFKSFPKKKTRFEVATNSMATAATEIMREPMRTFFRPIQSASSAQMREEITALDSQVLASRSHTCKGKKYVRSNRCSTESRLPFGWDNIAVSELVPKVFAELRNADNATGSLDIETNENDAPAGINTPGACPRIFHERFPDASVVVLLVSEMGELCILSRLDLLHAELILRISGIVSHHI